MSRTTHASGRRRPPLPEAAPASARKRRPPALAVQL